MSRRSRVVEPLEESELVLVQERMHNLLQSLSEREAGAVRLHYGLIDGNPRTLSEIARIYGVSSTRISQVLKRAKIKLGLDV